MNTQTPISAASDDTFAPPADGYIHVQPYGSYGFKMGDRKVQLVIDEPAVDAQIAAFKSAAEKAGPAFAGLLCDFDHFSCDQGQRSEAAAWATDLQKRDDGLWAKMRWTKKGMDAVKSGEYRFASNVHNPSDCEDLGGGKLRPLRVDRFALTNDPRMLQGSARMQPISSRATPDTTTTPKGKKMDHKAMLLTVLGLEATATDEQVQASLDAHKTEMAALKSRLETAETTLKSRAETAEKALAERKADDSLAALEKDGYKLTSRDEIRTRLVADHDNTLKTIRAFAPAVNTAPGKDEKGGEPLRSRGTPPDMADRKAQREDAIKAVQEKNGLKSRAAAVARAQREHPELWK